MAGATFDPLLGQLRTTDSSTAGVSSISKSGDTPLTGGVTLSEGANITLTQVGQDISIAASGGGSSPLTTKGDLFTYTTVNARLPVGSDGQILSSNSAMTTGLEWVTPATWGDVVGPSSASDNAITRYDGTTGKLIQNSSVFIDDTGRVGIGTSTPGQYIDLSNGMASGSFRIGADVNLNTRSTNTRKIGRIVGPSYGDDGTGTNNIFVLGVDAQSSFTSIDFGGVASGTPYAATQIRFYTAANTTTTGGTEAMQVNSSQNIGMGLTPGSTYRLQARSTAGNQFRADYDSLNYMAVSVASDGATSLIAGGTGSLFTFNKSVGITGDATVSAAGTTSTSVVTNSAVQTLTNKTLTTPTIASFVNANHDHTNSAGGGQLTDAALSTAVGVAKGGTGQTTYTNGQLLIGNTTGNTLTKATLTAGSGISVTNGTGTITIASTAVAWNNVTGTTQAAAINNGYIANNAGLVTVTIPSTAAIGSIVEVAGSGAGGWRMAQNASQTIHFGVLNTTTGTGGRLDSLNRYDSVRLICTTANTDWVVISSQGNITVT